MHTLDHESRQHRRHPVARALLAALLVAAWLLASGALAGGGAASPLTAASGPAPPTDVVPVVSSSYVVQPGDTLWSVARRMQPHGDVRPLVDHLGRQTGGRALRAGQRILLP